MSYTNYVHEQIYKNIFILLRTESYTVGIHLFWDSMLSWQDMSKDASIEHISKLSCVQNRQLNF
jgi:hypothetical protein